MFYFRLDNKNELAHENHREVPDEVDDGDHGHRHHVVVAGDLNVHRQVKL